MIRNVRFMSLLGGMSFILLGCNANLEGGDSNTGKESRSGSDPLPVGEMPSEELVNEIKGSLPWSISFDGDGLVARRLTRDELVATSRAVVGTALKRDKLPSEVRQGHGLLLTGGSRFVDSEIRALWPTVRDFAAEEAVQILSVNACSSAGEGAEVCLASWAHELASKAFRRALDADEKQALSDLVAGVEDTAEDHALVVEWVLQSIFFSPSFLFRLETGKGSPVEGELSDREIAVRLSFLATLGPPDAELATAAESGGLRDEEERVRQYRRLSQSSEGAKARAVFLLEWLNANESKIANKSEEYKEGLGDAFADEIRASAEQAILEVLDGANPTVTELFRTTNYMSHQVVQLLTADAEIGDRTSGDSYGADRKGVLMHPYLVSSHTKENGSSPFNLGIALREAVLCAPVTPPPEGATEQAATDPPAGLSERENLEYTTNAGPVCASCHSLFAPLGYSFMAFDPLGRWVAEDSTGAPWDFRGEVEVWDPKGGPDPDYVEPPISFDSPSSLGTQLGEHPQVLGCFTQAATQWAFGRKLVEGDALLVERLNGKSQDTSGNFVEVFSLLVSSPEFIRTTYPTESP